MRALCETRARERACARVSRVRVCVRVYVYVCVCGSRAHECVRACVRARCASVCVSRVRACVSACVNKLTVEGMSELQAGKK